MNNPYFIPTEARLEAARRDNELPRPLNRTASEVAQGLSDNEISLGATGERTERYCNDDFMIEVRVR